MTKEEKTYVLTADQLSYLRESGAIDEIKKYIDKKEKSLYNSIKSGQNATLEMVFEIRGRMKQLDDLKLIFNIKSTD